MISQRQELAKANKKVANFIHRHIPLEPKGSMDMPSILAQNMVHFLTKFPCNEIPDTPPKKEKRQP